MKKNIFWLILLVLIGGLIIVSLWLTNQPTTKKAFAREINKICRQNQAEIKDRDDFRIAHCGDYFLAIPILVVPQLENNQNQRLAYPQRITGVIKIYDGNGKYLIACGGEDINPENQKKCETYLNQVCPTIQEACSINN